MRECGAKAERARQINSIYSSAEDNNIPFIGGGGDATHSVVRPLTPTPAGQLPHFVNEPGMLNY